VRRRGGRKRAIGTRAPMLVPMTPNDRWSLDFVSDQLTDGRRFRILTVVDDCTRECLALVADTSLSGTRVARELDRLMVERDKPKMVVSERQRTHQQRHPDMGGSQSRRMALHRTGQAHAECLHRELQRPAAG
jgi:transposase InsO family protein